MYIIICGRKSMLHHQFHFNPLEFQFEGAPAKDFNPEAAKDFIKTLFLSVNPDPENKRIFPHFTCATDTENIKRVFKDVREHVLEENLKDYNLM